MLHTLCWQHECLAYGNIVGIAQAVVAEYGGHHGVGAVIAASDARKVVARFYLIINVLWCGVRVGLFAVFLCWFGADSLFGGRRVSGGLGGLRYMCCVMRCRLGLFSLRLGGQRVGVA